jgi:hypothetical protein
MYIFPTLSIPPTYPLDESYEDLTIRTGYEAGYDHTRPKYTSAFRKTYEVKYTHITHQDKSLLSIFITTVDEGLSTFTWVNPTKVGSNIVVRFGTLPKYSYIKKGYWDCDFTLVEE